MFNIDFVAFLLQFGIDLLAVTFFLVYLAWYYNWKKHNQVEEDFNGNLNNKYEYQQNRALYGRDEENSISLLKEGDQTSMQDLDDKRLNSFGNIDVSLIEQASKLP